MENQQHLMNTIGPMYVEEIQKQQAAQQVPPSITGNVTLPTT
jgi:hypothetical protein